MTKARDFFRAFFLVPEPRQIRALNEPWSCTEITQLCEWFHGRAVGVRPSMGSVEDDYDNAMCESFFATLECELLDRRRFKTQAEARTAVFEFIEGFYNPRRRHSSIGYPLPDRLRALSCGQAVRAAADTFWPNPKLDTAKVIMETRQGEALVSFLEGNGTPSMVERCMIRPPSGRVGPITMDERKALIEKAR
jgi:Bacterial protein of unknown function (DUF853)/Integrase core domain